MKIFYKKSSVFILLLTARQKFYYDLHNERYHMTKFHRNFNIMSMFTAVLVAVALVFWRTFLNIAASNVLLNGIIIGTTIFGIGLCFAQMFKLLPEYRWLHTYFDGRSTYGFVPKILRPIAMALHNRHAHITTSNLAELLDLVSVRIEEQRDSIRYITNTLIFLGLLGTFWGLIVTVGGFAQIMMNLDFADDMVMQTLQNNMAVPLAGMATAFTSSLLGLIGSLAVGFLGLQIQFAQNTVFQDLTDFLTQYALHIPDTTQMRQEMYDKAPVDEEMYTKISGIYDAFIESGYEINDFIRIDEKHLAIVATGTDEKLFLATVGVDEETLQNTLKRIELCLADTLEPAIKIDTKILCIGGGNSFSDKIIHFESLDAMQNYIASHINIRPSNKTDSEDFNAFNEYINTVMKYLFKTNI